MPTVLITETLDPRPAKWLGERVEAVWCAHDHADLPKKLATADGLVVRTYTQVNDALLAMAPRVRVVGRAGVGLDNIDLEACKRRGVVVVSTPDANTQAVVEYIFALVFDAIRPRYSLDKPVDAATFHKLRKEQVGRQLDELTLGILGLGRIGKRLGRAARAMGIRVIANDILPAAELRAALAKEGGPDLTAGIEFVGKEELFARSDVLSVHVDGRPENRGLVDAALLARLKPDCLFINAARGMLVDNAALAAWAKANAAKGGRLILDVHEPEPIPAEYPFWGMANVRLLPHLASRTGPAMENMSWVVRDVVAVLEGRKPEHPAF
ncbi:MAG: 3-phosphoglycerate dehydrogenase [Planctomycetota bacterium]|nr:3-phosphoglycerate dehydrogenase [Planctomycetota bacterium]